MAKKTIARVILAGFVMSLAATAMANDHKDEHKKEEHKDEHKK